MIVAWIENSQADNKERRNLRRRYFLKEAVEDGIVEVGMRKIEFLVVVVRVLCRHPLLLFLPLLLLSKHQKKRENEDLTASTFNTPQLVICRYLAILVSPSIPSNFKSKATFFPWC